MIGSKLPYISAHIVGYISSLGMRKKELMTRLRLELKTFSEFI
jgi:hypothetical protein